MRIFNFLNSNNDKHKSIRIKTDIGDKFVSVNLGQTYESMDILSLKVYQKDVYRLFDADYGIIVGRVLASGVGIPNCRISVFVPIDEETITNPTNLDDIKKIEAAALYPFKTILDKDGNGKIYNLLPKYSRNRNFNGFPDNDYGIGATPKTPVGTFSEKEEVVTNETVAYVYDKYYKFTTVTNESGDYILTVPSNRSYTVNMSCDITDIGRFSTTAALLKLDGLPDNFFTDDGLRINEDIPLERLPNIDIQNQGITVKPLWSQNENNTNVGINRLDFQITKKIKPFSTVIGNYFTPNNGTWWGDRIIFRAFFGLRNLCIGCEGTTNLSGGNNFGMALLLRICISSIGVEFQIGFSFNLENPTPSTNCDNPVAFCIQIRNVLPFFSVAGVLVNKYCTLNGGRNDYSPFELINLGKTNTCDLDKAKAVLNGLSDDLFIQSHQKGNLDLKVFNIKNSVPEEDAQILNEEGVISIGNNDTKFSEYSYKNDIELYSNNEYVFYQNNGSFITLINCNRNKVITNENGDLISVDDKSEKGVFTSFRGYFYVTNDANVDNPPTRNRTGKIALKIPQFVDYGDPNGSNSTFNKWVWKHYKFDYGKIYSVAQKNDVKEASMGYADELKQGDLLSSSVVGFDEQTNILYLGAFEETNDTVTYKRYNNTTDTRYTDFYNHVTVLGIDDDNTIQFQGYDGNSESISGSTQPPGQPLADPSKPTSIKLYDYDGVNFNTPYERVGWSMDGNPYFNPITSSYIYTLIKFKIVLQLPANYPGSLTNSKWDFKIISEDQQQIFEMQANGTPWGGVDFNILWDRYSLEPDAWFVTNNGEKRQIFNITFSLNDTKNFSRWHNLGSGFNTSSDWSLEVVLSNNVNNESYFKRTISTINYSTADPSPEYIKPPY
jgi:hypothetical protein